MHQERPLSLAADAPLSLPADAPLHPSPDDPITVAIRSRTTTRGMVQATRMPKRILAERDHGGVSCPVYGFLSCCEMVG